MNYIVFTAGPLMGKQIPIKGIAVTFGRAHYNSVPVPDQAVSDEHCSIVRLRDARWVVRDLGSQNGTYLNGVRVPEEANIKSGDKIQLGTSVFNIRFAQRHVIPGREDLEPQEAGAPAPGPAARPQPAAPPSRKGPKVDIESDVDEYLKKLTGKG